MLEYIILGMLLNEPLTGYDVKKFIEHGVGTFYKASYGSLYPSLKRMTEKGDLIMFEHPQGGRQKKYYQITEQGKTTFLKWLTTPAGLNDNTDNHLAKVYFFDSLSTDLRDQQLQEYEQNSMNYLQKLLELEKKCAALENKDLYYYKRSTLYYGIRMTQDSIRWCRHIRAKKPLTELMDQELMEFES
jgi:DNA-binding PadR family transcriptional regulator